MKAEELSRCARDFSATVLLASTSSGTPQMHIKQAGRGGGFGAGTSSLTVQQQAWRRARRWASILHVGRMATDDDRSCIGEAIVKSTTSTRTKSVSTDRNLPTSEREVTRLHAQEVTRITFRRGDP
jgi:hypothetical protein